MLYTVCIGSNECRRVNLALARQRLAELFPDIRFSHEVDTPPLHMGRKALFANQVARFESEKNPAEVIFCLKSIEREAGSTRQERANEIIRLDIDLLACDGLVYKPADWGRIYVKKGINELNAGF